MTETALDLEVWKAISLTQPWASLMAIGAKKNETRSWYTNYRGWLAIHASKGFPADCRALCAQEPFAAALASAGYKSSMDLPRGSVVAVVRVLDCVRVEEYVRSIAPDDRLQFLSQEERFGDYSRGRYAYITADARRLKQPIPLIGSLSIWQMPKPLTAAELAD